MASSRRNSPRPQRVRRNAGGLTHLDARGRVRMVDVGRKPVTRREAIARGRIEMAPATLAAILGVTVWRLYSVGYGLRE